MPKIKTNKAMADRIKITKNGKLIHKKSRRSHLLTNKWRSNKVFTLGKEISGHYVSKIRRLLPYA